MSGRLRLTLPGYISLIGDLIRQITVGHLGFSLRRKTDILLSDVPQGVLANNQGTVGVPQQP